MAYYDFHYLRDRRRRILHFFPSSWSEFEIRGSKNCEKYIQGLKMMDEIADKSSSTYAKLKYNKYIGKIIGT